MKVINEDYMYGLDQMDENSIDLLITDPPKATPLWSGFFCLKQIIFLMNKICTFVI